MWYVHACWPAPAPAVEFADVPTAVANLNFCRDSARDWSLLTAIQRAAFREADARLYTVFSSHFDRWLVDAAADWLICLNMTLTDSPSATRALMGSICRYFASRPGGAIFWDRDLFSTYAVHKGNTAVYPTRPNEVTPLPTRRNCRRWVVVSPVLLREALTYGVDIVPELIPNPLPRVTTADDAVSTEMLQRFCSEWQLEAERPFVLAQVYGAGYNCTRVDPTTRGRVLAFAAVLRAFAGDDPMLDAQLRRYAAIAGEVFPDGPWLTFWEQPQVCLEG
jgi:hypothetical protein